MPCIFIGQQNHPLLESYNEQNLIEVKYGPLTNSAFKKKPENRRQSWNLPLKWKIEQIDSL